MFCRDVKVHLHVRLDQLMGFAWSEENPFYFYSLTDLFTILKPQNWSIAVSKVPLKL